MKKIFFLTLAILFTAGIVLAANPNAVHEPGTGVQNPEVKQQVNKSTVEVVEGVNDTDTQAPVNTQIQTQNNAGENAKQGSQKESVKNQETVQVQVQVKKNNPENGEMIQSQLRQRIQLQKEQSETLQSDKNQNQVRNTVQNLLIVKDFVDPGIGEQISAVAQEFNNSIDKTIQAENRIKNRNALVKFFIGSDTEALSEIENQITENAGIVKELKLLKTNIADPEAAEIFTDQILEMEQEQTRLQTLANSEVTSSGVFGWLRGLFNRK